MDFNRPLLTVTGGVDGDVLTALAVAEAWFTVSRLDAVIDRWSDAGIRKALSRLVDQGVVETESAGPAVLYRLNRTHLASRPIEQLANLWSAFVEELARELDGWVVRPKVAALFGSAARGTMTSQSDIDIFLVQPTASVHDARWDSAVRTLELKASQWTGNDVRVLQMTESHVRARAGDEPVLGDVAFEGVRLSGDLDWLRRLVTRARTSRGA